MNVKIKKKKNIFFKYFQKVNLLELNQNNEELANFNKLIGQFGFFLDT